MTTTFARKSLPATDLTFEELKNVVLLRHHVHPVWIDRLVEHPKKAADPHNRFTGGKELKRKIAPKAIDRYKERTPRPRGRACPAPTPHAPHGQGRNHAVGDLGPKKRVQSAAPWAPIDSQGARDRRNPGILYQERRGAPGPARHTDIAPNA
jgi:hypothetical protein